MRELSPRTSKHYKEEIALYKRLKASGTLQSELLKYKPSTRAHRIVVWNKYCRAKLPLPYEKIHFDPKCIPSKELERFKQFISGYCNEDQKLFIDLGLRLGLRLSEILSVKRDSIRDDGIAIIRKGGKLQILPCPKDILDRIRISDGVKFKSAYYQAMMIRISKVIGIHVSAHSLRHTFATEAIRGDANIVLIKEILGHSDLNTTMKYIAIAPEQLRSIIK